MILAALLLVQTDNLGFERELDGWRIEGHRGMRGGVLGNPGYMVRQSYEGDYYLSMGWAGRSRAPDEAQIRAETRLDATPYRGLTLVISAVTKVPDFASSVGYMYARAGGASAESRIVASEDWRRHGVTLAIPPQAETIEIGFATERTAAQLAVDDVRIEVQLRASEPE